MSQKSGVTYVICYIYARFEVDSDDSLPLEKTLILHNMIILLKSVFYKEHYNVLLEKCLYQLPEK